MMIEPPIEELSEKVGNKFKLCIVVSKRAKEIQAKNFEAKVEPEITEITQAANEAYTGKIVADE